MMLACHLVVASERSQFGLPEARIGCMPGFGGTQRLSASVGKPAAMHLMLSGERIDADRAWQLGLLSVPPLAPEATSAEVARLAQLIASGSRTGLANILDAARPAVAPAALDHEAALAALCHRLARRPGGHHLLRRASGPRLPRGALMTTWASVDERRDRRPSTR